MTRTPALAAPRRISTALRALRATAIAAVLALCCAGEAAAVAVSPNALYIDHRTRTGTLTLYNPGNLPEEITLSFAFGYPRSDAEGTITVPLDSVAPAGEPSVLPWVRAFPKRLRLEPGQRQVVRILVSPPAGLAAGEYWGRIRIHSTGGQPPIEQTLDGNVRTSVSVAMEIVAPVNYRNGDVATGVRVAEKSARTTPEGVELVLDLERQGNAAFVGRVQAQLLAPDGRVVAEAADGLAVYRGLRKVVRIPLAEPRRLAGHRVVFTLDTERPDLPPESVLPAAQVSDSVLLP
ncbi:MAG TPA: hypothetical protein VHG51_13765 [Longimicrobiaceae bacterium]|nr:hypothetical protein [Longimicrobiaceae bacterium]